MKANELMIGGWVNYRGTFIKVTSLYDKGGSNEIGWGKIESTWVNGCCIEPILLTREILEKNEFTYCKKNGAFYAYEEESYSNQMVEIILYNIENENRSTQLHINYVFQEDETMIHLIECNFVHNLQHALRILRIKKEIVL